MFGVIKLTLMVIMVKTVQKMHPFVNIFTPVYLPNVLFLSSQETQPILPVRPKQLDTLCKYAEVNIFTNGCIF